MNYRLIALDVDGTLLNDRYELTERTIRAVRDVADRGATIVLCTGRSPVNTLPILERLGLEGTVITHNGAATVRSQDRHIVHKFTFDIGELDEIFAYCRDNGLHYDVCTPFQLYVDEELSDEVAGMYDKYMLQPTRIAAISELPEQPVKFTVFGDKQAIDRAERDWAELELPLTVLRSGDYFIDLMHPDATKGSALRELALSLGIDRTEVAAIGNYYNDIEMIRYAGLGIAMDNSPEDVKRAADAVTVSNNEEGVYVALNRYVF